MSRENGTGADDRRALHLDATDAAPRIRVLSVRGEIDMITAPGLRTAMLAEIAAFPARLVVDLTRVRFMGSNGLAILMEALEEATTAGVEMRSSRRRVPSSGPCGSPACRGSWTFARRCPMRSEAEPRQSSGRCGVLTPIGWCVCAPRQPTIGRLAHRPA